MEKDSRPEFVHYKDDGCELAPSCLECPCEKCVLDEPIRMKMKQKRNEEIKRKAKEGVAEADLAGAYGLSPRTIQRILNK